MRPIFNRLKLLKYRQLSQSDDQEQAELVRNADQTMVQRLRVSSNATDGDIQRRLDILYRNQREDERRQRAQEEIVGQQFCEEPEAQLCITSSRVQLDRAFRDSRWQQVSIDEEYAEIVQQL